MVRVVRTQDGAMVDARQTMPGRGAYVHADPECQSRAVKRGGLARTLHCEVPDSLFGALVDVVRKRD
jgi:uncharacterized protein